MLPRDRIVGKCFLGSAMLIFAIESCSTQGSITSDPKAEIDRLGSNFSVLERLGETPIKIVEESIVARYEVRHKGARPEYLIVMYPQEVKGDIALNVNPEKGQGRNFDAYANYLDAILRAHRQVVRGEFSQARKLIDALDGEYGTTFAGLYLSGIISLVEGKFDDASRDLRMARSLYPEAIELNELIP